MEWHPRFLRFTTCNADKGRKGFACSIASQSHPSVTTVHPNQGPTEPSFVCGMETWQHRASPEATHVCQVTFWSKIPSSRLGAFQIPGPDGNHIPRNWNPTVAALEHVQTRHLPKEVVAHGATDGHQPRGWCWAKLTQSTGHHHLNACDISRDIFADAKRWGLIIYRGCAKENVALFVVSSCHLTYHAPLVVTRNPKLRWFMQGQIKNKLLFGFRVWIQHRSGSSCALPLLHSQWKHPLCKTLNERTNLKCPPIGFQQSCTIFLRPMGS